MSIINLKLLRNIFLRAAFISVLMTWFLALLTMGFWDTWLALTSKIYKVAPESLTILVVMFFTAAKFFSIFVLLVPGLAFHWTVKKSTV